MLTETVTSPTWPARSGRSEGVPRRAWHQYEPAAPHACRAGLKAYFGRDLTPRYQVEKADVIVSLDADFLANGVRPPARRARVRPPPRARRTAR